MSVTSKIPATVDALITLARANLTGVEVFDGPPTGTTGLENLKRLFVGDSGEGGPAVDGEYQVLTFGGERREVFTVSCVAESLRGDADMKAARDEAFTIHGDLDGLLRVDPTVGGAVFVARIVGRETVRAMQPSDGALCAVTFQVACESQGI